MATLGVEKLQLIASVERPKALNILRQSLGWEEFDPENDPQKDIILDFHYNNLMFCVQKGFPWKQIGHLVNLAATVANESKGQKLPEAVKIYHKACQNISNTVSEKTLKVFTQFFFETFLRHYQIYQFVLTKEQEAKSVKVRVDIETPVQPLPFSDGKQQKLWDYEEKLKEIEREEAERKEQREKEMREKLNEEEKRKLEGLKNLQNTESPLRKEELILMINDIASHHLTAAGYAIQSSLQTSMDELEFMLKKTSLPRPQELGPPPRYKTKTPLSGGLKRPKSTQKTKSANNACAAASGKGKMK